MRRPHPYTRLATVAIAVLLTGCSAAAGTPPHDHAKNTAPLPLAPEVTVTATGTSFSPSTIALQTGEPVNLVLTAVGSFHDVNVEGTEFHLGAHANETAIGGLILNEPGTYTAYCSVAGHREAGMEMTITVR